MRKKIWGYNFRGIFNAKMIKNKAVNSKHLPVLGHMGISQYGLK